MCMWGVFLYMYIVNLISRINQISPSTPTDINYVVLNNCTLVEGQSFTILDTVGVCE